MLKRKLTKEGLKITKTEYCNCLALCKDLFLHPTISKNGECLVCGFYTVKSPNIQTDKVFEEELGKKLKKETEKLRRKKLFGHLGRPQTEFADTVLIEKIKMIQHFIEDGKL
jgi:hypothetical protein